MDDSLLPLPQLPSLSELESRMQLVRVSALEENQTGETLLSLCQDLYDAYATLLDRFHHSDSQNLKPISHDITSESSEVESILSFQHMQVTSDKHNIDELLSQLVTANSEKDAARNELRRVETKFKEASKTIELLKKLVMLIDMEKEVAVEETASLGQRLTSLLEENRELATEALFMKKEAVRLARCMLKMRDDHFHKVCLLQNQIYQMESSRESPYENVSTPSCFGLDSSKSKKRKTRETRSEPPGEKKRSKWLKRLNPFAKSAINPSSSPLS